jgi:hypothetical protein
MELFIIDEWEEMEEALREGNLEVIDIVCKVVKKGVKRKFKQVTMFAVSFRDEPEYEYDWILESSQYKTMLENCIEVYSRHEMYEKCAEIKNIVDTL